MSSWATAKNGDRVANRPGGVRGKTSLSCTALLVGGDVPMLTLFQLVFERQGIRASLTTTSSAALLQIAEERPTLLVLDDALSLSDLLSIIQAGRAGERPSG